MSLYVRLFVDWRGYLRGETIEVSDNTGKALIRENIAKFYEKEKPKKAKQVKGAPKDKMLKSAPVTK
ncbi:hypothetical protein ES705_33634 [subsurface metagenome]